MTTDPKLESYLSELEKSLWQIPVSDRAEIITEIKSHILEVQNHHPEQNMSDILNSMGDPESVAKKYLEERGLKIMKSSSPSSMMWLANSIKWLVIGFISFLILVVLSFSLIVWKFSPLISVKEDRVVIAGGLIDVQDDEKQQPKNIPSSPVVRNPNVNNPNTTVTH